MLDTPAANAYDVSMNAGDNNNAAGGGTGKPRRGAGRPMLAAVGVYVLAWLIMNVFVIRGIQRETIRIEGPAGKASRGTVWTPDAPKAVILLGHGVTANQGVMAMLANSFARNGYIAVTLDFWGHGRSREKFDWSSNAAQVNAWCAWARARFDNLPLAYLGHSMGGEAGGRAFRDTANVEAFVSLGMLPRERPACQTLIALGRFEELFSPGQARRVAEEQGGVEVLVSPFSDHILEACDPILLQGIVAWVNEAIGREAPVTFPWVRWGLLLGGTVLGGAAALVLAEHATRMMPHPATAGDIPHGARPGRFNLFGIAAKALGYRGNAAPPRAGNGLSAALCGIVFSLTFILLLSWILTRNVYTCRVNHPERCLTWLGLTPVMVLLFSLTARALERNPLRTAFQRFAVGALTRAVPLLVIGLVLELLGPGIAFAGMALIILAFVFVLIAAVYALATRGAGDYRAGVVASAITLAWIAAFWFPLVWG